MFWVSPPLAKPRISFIGFSGLVFFDVGVFFVRRFLRLCVVFFFCMDFIYCRGLLLCSSLRHLCLSFRVSALAFLFLLLALLTYLTPNPSNYLFSFKSLLVLGCGNKNNFNIPSQAQESFFNKEA
jgi:hypothetical protein